MTFARFLPAAAVVVALGAVEPALASGTFTCPTQPANGTVAAQVQAALPTGDALDKPEALENAVTGLKAAGISPAVIINDLITTYCPLVAADTTQTDAQKATSVLRFAARVTRTVFSMEGADQIILDVAFPPDVVDGINAKASAAGITPEAWIQTTVAGALK